MPNLVVVKVLVYKMFQEQANEREQEHEDYQKELDKWKKIVQDIEKQNGSDKRLQTEVGAFPVYEYKHVYFDDI